MHIYLHWLICCWNFLPDKFMGDSSASVVQSLKLGYSIQSAAMHMKGGLIS